MADERLYRVGFYNQGQVYEVYARQVSQGGLYGFIEVEELIFGETTKIVVDPAEERLQREFKGVKRFFVPMHAVVRIDEVEKRGTSTITPPPKEDSKIATFPMPIYGPRGSGGKD